MIQAMRQGWVVGIFTSIDDSVKTLVEAWKLQGG